MQIELKQKWIEALRSGKYQQGRNWLNADDKFCCLGVLIDICEPSGWFTKPDAMSNAKSHRLGCATDNYLGKGFHQAGTVSSTAMLIGISIPTHMDQTAEVGHVLARMNDEGASFDEIADWIEANVPVES